MPWPLPPLSRALDGVRLHVVTGKGGAGKTTVAAALALALVPPGQAGAARRGRGPPGHQPDLRRPAARHRGGAPRHATPAAARCGASRSTPRPRCSSTSQIFYKLGRAGGALERIGVIDFATTIAPGVRDVLLTGKVYEAVGRTTGTRRHQGPKTWDAVVLDAPPTGRIARFLNVNVRGGRPRPDGPDPQPGRVDHPDAARPADASCTS